MAINNVKADRQIDACASFDGGSYRDNRARVVEHNGRILRFLNEEGAQEYAWLEQSGLLARLIDDRAVVATKRISKPHLEAEPGIVTLLEHERIPFISYPYEWPFTALKNAALHHLALHRSALDAGATLLDASAYNIQFRGSDPVFIDVPSLRRYRDGEYWLGHQQFLDQFLNPLLCDALCNVGFQQLYRGKLEGITTSTLNRMLPLRHKVRPSILMHVIMPAALQRTSGKNVEIRAANAVKRRPLPKSAFIGMLDGLTKLIQSLVPRRPKGVWTEYESNHSYMAADLATKRTFVQEYVAKTRPKSMLDLGCNTGVFSEVALRAGASSVIGAEQDGPTADLAYERAKRSKLAFLPLVLDAADPSPAQGWLGRERRSFADRAAFDGMIALAVEHHLAIGRNIPLDQLIGYLVDLAPHGVIEFVPKADPQVQRLMALREDIFPTYAEDTFAALLAARSRIVRQEKITASGRKLFWFDRGEAS